MEVQSYLTVKQLKGKARVDLEHEKKLQYLEEVMSYQNKYPFNGLMQSSLSKLVSVKIFNLRECQIEMDMTSRSDAFCSCSTVQNSFTRTNFLADQVRAASSPTLGPP